jgi:Lon protease-like protein
MPDYSDFTFDPTEFRGVARLFPLPGVVLYPGLMKPLHVFEPRYKELLADALQGDKLIALALLQPGWEKHYDERPPVAPVACLGRVVTNQQLADGTSNILVVGLRRVEISRELPPSRPFREAVVKVLEDYEPPHQATTGVSITELKEQLVNRFRIRLAPSETMDEQMQALLESNLSLGMLTDLIASGLECDMQHKIDLLLETNVIDRAALLLSILDELEVEKKKEPRGKFPPDFSAN